MNSNVTVLMITIIVLIMTISSSCWANYKTQLEQFTYILMYAVLIIIAIDAKNYTRPTVGISVSMYCSHNFCIGTATTWQQ